MDSTAMVPRPTYLSLLESYRDREQVKVLQGVRRCGKSTLLQMFQQTLIEDGVDRRNIFFKRFDLLEEPLTYESRNLLDDILEAYKASDRDHMFYVFLDEIQDVAGWEKVVRKLHTERGIDIYITGSNAHLLSSDLATYLSGRVSKIDVYPLSFGEYLEFEKRFSADNADKEQSFANYLRFGGMPSLFLFHGMNREFTVRELSALTDTVLYNDVALRVGIRDIALLQRLVTYVFSTSGNLFSTRKVQGALANAGRKTSVETIENYLAALEQAYLLYEAPQAGIAGKRVLNPLRKYYVADTGLRNLSIGFAQRDRGFQLENIVYMELKRRGYDVVIGALPTAEIDFVAQHFDEKCSIQVCESLIGEGVFDREVTPLRRVNDSFPKYVLTLDRLSCGTTDDGIKVVHLIDWLLEAQRI